MPGNSVLDIGTQNLYFAEAQALKRFFSKRNVTVDDATCRRLAEGGSRVGARVRDDSFLGEVIELAGMGYRAFDVIDAPRTEVFDLNADELNPADKCHFDLVLNFGTTEHVINQYNAFKTIHEATKSGGWMFHQVPATGYVNHGFFVYSPMTFSKLAAANRYEIRDLWLEMQAPNRVFDAIVEHRDLMRAPDRIGNDVKKWDKTLIVNSVVNVLLRKTTDSPFRLSLEPTGSVAAEMQARYFAPAPLLPMPQQQPNPKPTSALIENTKTVTLAAEVIRRLLNKVGLTSRRA